MNIKFALDASSNSTSHTLLPQRLCEKFRGGLNDLLSSPLVDFKTNPVDQHDQRTIVCFRHADNTSHRKLPLIERVLKHILDICGDVELRINVETQTSNMRCVNATRNNVLDLKKYADGEHQQLSTDQSPSPSVWASHLDDALGHTRGTPQMH